MPTNSEQLQKILTRQSLQPKDLKFTLMVGGSTFIPFVRKHVEEVMGIPVNTGIDPTNAIVVGAAFFAGAKLSQSDKGEKKQLSRNSEIKVRATYERSSQELEEMFSAKIEGNINGMTYRIHSLDGSFDSNIKALENRINEDLPLREGEYNIFEFSIMSADGNLVSHDHGQIQIAQGRYSVAGQMLPFELSLVKDLPGDNETMLDCLFEKNCILPTRSKRTVEVGRTVNKGATGKDDKIKIIVVEGSSDAHHLSNKLIGTLEVTGDMVKRDLLKGTEIDLTFELSESRDLTVSAYLNGTGQDFSQVFNPQKRDVKASALGDDIIVLENMIQREQEEAIANGSHDVERNLGTLLEQTQAILKDVEKLSEDSVTDEKFPLEDKKRAVAAEVYQLTSNKRSNAAKTEYFDMKDSVTDLVRNSGNDHEKHLVREVTAREEVFLKSSNADTIEAATNELGAVRYQIMMRTPAYLISSFEYLVESRISMNDQVQAKSLIANGKNLIENESWDDLNIVIGRLWNLMPETERESEEARMFTGIV